MSSKSSSNRRFGEEVNMKMLFSAIVGCQLFLGASLFAENRFYINDVTLPPGASGEEIPILADNDVDLYGFSFGINYDETMLTVTDVTIAGTIASVADFFDGQVDTARGLIGYGCVMDWDPPLSDIIPVGTGHVISIMTVDVLAPCGAASDIVFETVPTNPDPERPVKNVMTNDEGRTVVPVTVKGTVTVGPCAPVITAITDNVGTAGQVLRVVGEFFDIPGLSVTVCSIPASATLEPDGVTLLVTAPGCGAYGPVPVEVCTNDGCDSDPAGFTYLKPFLRADPNDDTAVDISDGVSVLLYLFEETAPRPCLDSLDTNDSGSVDISDAVYVFNFLFLDGEPIPEPFPESGFDPTPDALPLCE